jgi:uncharacterized protein
MTLQPGPVTGEAASPDGRSFTYRVPRESPLLAGDLVLLDAGPVGQFLGQVREDQSELGSDHLRGAGAVIGPVGADGAPTRGERRAFSRAAVTPGSTELLRAVQAASGATLPLGTWRCAGVETPAMMRAQGFNRHTFLCGQSGSGKTYALGVILEQLILATSLRMVILDPNADFSRLGEARRDAPDAAAERIGGTDVRVLTPHAAGGEPLRMRFATMPRAAQAAVLQLDPLADRDEYNIFVNVSSDVGTMGVHELATKLLAGGTDERALAQRIQNLGLAEWEVWAGDKASAYEVMSSGARVTVMNLAGFRNPLEPLAVSLDLIERLWDQRETRTPTLMVIDEAHNLCPAEPSGPLQSAVTSRLIQIAAEGRKYGLWLLLSTQRPSKLHPQVLSQCDNLALMRMNSPGDVEELSRVFGFVPPAMMQASHSFAQGEILTAGPYVPTPGFVQIGARVTHEGGSDVTVPVG